MKESRPQQTWSGPRHSLADGRKRIVAEDLRRVPRRYARRAEHRAEIDFCSSLLGVSRCIYALATLFAVLPRRKGSPLTLDVQISRAEMVDQCGYQSAEIDRALAVMAEELRWIERVREHEECPEAWREPNGHRHTWAERYAVTRPTPHLFAELERAWAALDLAWAARDRRRRNRPERLVEKLRRKTKGALRQAASRVAALKQNDEPKKTLQNPPRVTSFGHRGPRIVENPSTLARFYPPAPRAPCSCLTANARGDPLWCAWHREWWTEDRQHVAARRRLFLAAEVSGREGGGVEPPLEQISFPWAVSGHVEAASYVGAELERRWNARALTFPEAYPDLWRRAPAHVRTQMLERDAPIRRRLGALVEDESKRNALLSSAGQAPRRWTYAELRRA
jgi:hypothetical protein